MTVVAPSWIIGVLMADYIPFLIADQQFTSDCPWICPVNGRKSDENMSKSMSKRQLAVRYPGSSLRPLARRVVQVKAADDLALRVTADHMDLIEDGIQFRYSSVQLDSIEDGLEKQRSLDSSTSAPRSNPPPSPSIKGLASVIDTIPSSIPTSYSIVPCP